MELEAEQQSQTQVAHNLREHIRTLKDEIIVKLENLPTINDVEDIVNKSTTTPSQEQATSHNQEILTAPRTTSQRETQEGRQRPRSPSPGLNRLHKRTIVIKGATTKITSREIQHTLNRYKTCTAITIEKIIPKKHHIEIVCKNTEEAEILKKEMQGSRILNETLAFITKQAHTEKMRIFNVPQSIDKEDVTQAILKTYKAYRDEIHILRSQRSRQDEESNDWILVLPIQLGRAAIRGGLTLGFRHCRVRPHTAVQRCLQCQAFDHPTRRCQNSPYCVNCGERHTPGSCDKPPRCINCVYSNRHRETNYPSNHRASDYNCPCYKEFYSEERQRLDNIFLDLPSPPLPADQGLFTMEDDFHRITPWHQGGFWPGPPPHFGHWPQIQRNDQYENFEDAAARRGGNRRPRQ